MRKLRSFAIAAGVTVLIGFLFVLVQQSAAVDLSLVSFVVVMLAVLAAVLLGGRLRRNVAPPGDVPPGDVVAIPVLWSATGTARLPLVLLAHNSLRPRLELGAAQLRYGMFGHSAPYRAIRRVEARSLLGQHHLTLFWTDSWRTFTVDVATREWQRRALEILASHGVPLGDSARAVLAEDTGEPNAPKLAAQTWEH